MRERVADGAVRYLRSKKSTEGWRHSGKVAQARGSLGCSTKSLNSHQVGSAGAVGAGGKVSGGVSASESEVVVVVAAVVVVVVSLVVVVGVVGIGLVLPARRM